MEPALQEALLPKYIAIEGPIGVGKTTLAHKIAETFNYDVFLEQPTENPFEYLISIYIIFFKSSLLFSDLYT